MSSPQSSTLRFEFARAIIERDVAARALPRVPANSNCDVRAFNLDEAVRLATAGKCYKPAPQWSVCPHCAQPVSTRERVALETDERGKVTAIYHAGCHEGGR